MRLRTQFHSSEIKSPASKIICFTKTLFLAGVDESRNYFVSSLLKRLIRRKARAALANSQQETEALDATVFKDLTPSKMDIKTLCSVIKVVTSFNLCCVLLVRCKSEMEGITQEQE